MALPVFGSFLLVGLASAQSHVDPFAGSGCNCTSFCAGECAINATKPANSTVYRMTPFGVLGLGEKNSADVPGDVSFVVSRRTVAYKCKLDPSGFGCKSMVQFQGDNPNSTDLVLEMAVEWDGQWGPYLYCNDVNVSDPLGAWKCTVELNGAGSVPHYPDSCKADHFEPYPDLCLRGNVVQSEKVQDIAGCCALAEKHSCKLWTLNTTTMQCDVMDSSSGYSHCEDGIAASYDPPTNYCNCSRVHETVGLENISSAFGAHNRQYHVAGGTWYSHPANGECKDGHYVGDGSGCTWRHVKTTSAINASCMYNRIDTAIEQHWPHCFERCPPGNKTCDCYNFCYLESSLGMTVEQLTDPWVKAMSRGPEGCPQVDLSSVDAPAYQKPDFHH